MNELSEAVPKREKLWTISSQDPVSGDLKPTERYLLSGLALTVGSAVESSPPSTEACLTAFTLPNSAGLTAGARAWSKHAHRSSSSEEVADKSKGWWGTPRGPVSKINDEALKLFWKVMNGGTWRNLHWLPHEVLVYEVRLPEGYGMRWSQGRPGALREVHGEFESAQEAEHQPWLFRGFVEPMMENGHEVGWRH